MDELSEYAMISFYCHGNVVSIFVNRSAGTNDFFSVAL